MIHTLFDIHPSTIFFLTQEVFIAIVVGFFGSFLLEFIRKHLASSSLKKTLKVFPPLLRWLSFIGLILIVSRIAGIPVIAMPILLLILPIIFIYFVLRAVFIYFKLEGKKTLFSGTNEYESTKQKYLSKRRKK